VLDQPVSEFAKKNFPQYAGMVPEKYAKMTVREAYKGANFLEKQMFASKLATALPKGVTMDDINKAVNEPPPPKAPAAAAPLPSAAASAPPPVAPAVKPPVPVAAVAPPPAPAPAPAPAAATAPPVGDIIAPPAAAARGPTNTAAAALPTGGNSALDYLAKYGGHGSVLRDGRIVSVHPGEKGAYQPVNPELAARLHAAGVAFERETGKTPKFGEFSRGEDVQKVYRDKYEAGTGGIAAKPGHSQHQQGGAGDLPDSDFRKWLYAGNKDRFGLHFPVKGDTPHVQINPAFKGQLATGTGSAPGTPQADVQAGAGPAAVAAARARDVAPRPAATGSAFPQGTAPQTQAAITALANRIGVSPAAISGIIKTESNWNTNAASPGKGTYRGLTQIGPDTFKEAGGKLGGMTYDEFLKASPDKQVEAYGGYLDHYGLSAKAKAAGIDFSKMSPAQQAAHLQAFQFSPAVSDWQGGDPNKPVTASKQASALGTTSLADMTKYYENLLKGSGGGDTPLDPTPNVGSGQSDYDTGSDPGAVASSLGGGVGAGSGGGAVADAAPAASGSSFGGGIGEAFEGIAKAFAGSGARALPSTPANAAMPQMPMPTGIVPLVDPRHADAQRQMLAMAMQRLNSGKLF
jgi:hypothetical protein